MDPVAARLPGMQPLDPADWIRRDDAFAAQMALRDQLIETRPDDVIAIQSGALTAVRECLSLVLDHLSSDPDYVRLAHGMRRPDGGIVDVAEPPLPVLGRLVQNDICILEKDDNDGWRLTAAVLCFPASWSLAEKLGRDLPGIHGPVPEYGVDLARRVQRLFDAIRPDRPLWRANWLIYDDPTLFQPRQEDDPRRTPTRGAGQYLRSERQTLRRLPRTGAVVFTIHTTVMPLEDLPDPARSALLSERKPRGQE